MAGEVLAVGKDAGSEWKKGDRVCANFLADHIAGETTLEILNTAHGGSIQGVLTQYRSFRSHVSVVAPSSHAQGTNYPALCSHLSRFQITSRMKKPRRCRDWSLFIFRFKD